MQIRGLHGRDAKCSGTNVEGQDTLCRCMLDNWENQRVEKKECLWLYWPFQAIDHPWENENSKIDHCPLVKSISRIGSHSLDEI